MTLARSVVIMRFYLLLLLLLLLGVIAAAAATINLPPPSRPYKILMLLPVSSTSHRNVFMPLATALADRGHKIVMLSNDPPPDNNPNITYINHELPHFKTDKFNYFDLIKNPGNTLGKFSIVLPKFARELYKVPAVKELYANRKQFDLVITDAIFNELCNPFAEGLPFITIACGGLEATHSAVYGNVQNPATLSNMMTHYHHPMGFVDRINNIFMTLMMAYKWRHQNVIPLVQKEISAQFPDVAPLLEIERNQSLMFLNTHFTISGAYPLLPGQVEMGGIHCRPGLPLSQELSDYVTGNVPVVYFSLGSIARSSTMPTEYKEMLLAAFAKLPYKFIWKYEDENINLPKNVIVRKWLPQQDLLAHPNVKLFISHCGLLSTHEAVYHNTPMLCLPIFADQPKQSEVMQEAGRGRFLSWITLTEQNIVDTIKDLMENPSYQKKVSAISKAFKDQPETPLQRAVFWTEYVIRHKGAPHLQSPEKQLTWIQLLHLDIILFLYLALYLVYQIVKRCIAACCRGTTKSIKKKKTA